MDAVADDNESAALGRGATVQVSQHPVRGLLHTLLVLADLRVIYIINDDEVWSQCRLTHATWGLPTSKSPETYPVLRDEVAIDPFAAT